MKIKLLAILKSSGRAFIQEGDGSVYHIRPPYNSLSSKIYTNISDVNISIKEHGYVSSEEFFNDYPSLTKHLINLYEEFIGTNKKNHGTQDLYATFDNLNPIFFDVFASEIANEYETNEYKNVIKLGEELLSRNPGLKQHKAYSEVTALIAKAKDAISMIVKEERNIFPYALGEELIFIDTYPRHISIKIASNQNMFATY